MAKASTSIVSLDQQKALMDNAEIAGIVARQAELRTQIDAIVSDLEGDAV